MQTKIVKPTKKNIATCAQSLRQGFLVGMPTETVYGLAANAFDQKAVERIFEAKNRPQDNPLIVHVHANYDLTQLVSNITPLAKACLQAFTPGPITLVMKSKGTVCPAVSKGLETVAVRIPNHKVAQRFLRACDLPVAAPSANMSSRMSATSAKAVKQELDGKLPYVLDGGVCQIGIESTVVDVTGEIPIILRPGKITKEQLQTVAKQVQEKTKYQAGEKVFSPGVKYKHYSPNIPVFVAQFGAYNQANNVYEEMKQEGLKPVIVCVKSEKQKFKGKPVILFGKTEQDIAKNLYAVLRKAEKSYTSAILCAPKETAFGLAVLNRMSKMNSYKSKIK